MMSARHPLILIPGLLCNHKLWTYQRDALEKLTSIIFADITGVDSIENMALKILDNAPQKFDLAGLSMGGYVALEIMRIAPDRVNKLVLLNTTYREVSTATITDRLRAIELAKAGLFAKLLAETIGQCYAASNKSNTKILKLDKEMALEVGPEVYIQQQTAIMNRRSYADILPLIRNPTLIIAGEEDEITPPQHSVEMAGSLYNAKLVVLKDCGHISTFERPREVTEEMTAFLR